MDFAVTWNEDGSATALGRITARDGTGLATGISGEGRFLKQADVSTITCKVFDEDGDDPNAVTATPTVTVSSAIQDTPVTNQEIWTEDTTGYNFLHDLAASNYPIGGNRYRVEYKGTLTGGGVFHGSYTGPANPIRSS